jgi:DNA-binding protein HU-beta
LPHRRRLAYKAATAFKIHDKGAIMTKEDFVVKLATAGKVTKTQADAMFSTFVEMLAGSIKKGERVAIPGLGVFSVVQKKARTGRNPATGAAIKIPARKAVKFSVSSTLKQGLNKAKKK